MVVSCHQFRKHILIAFFLISQIEMMNNNRNIIKECKVQTDEQWVYAFNETS